MPTNLLKTSSFDEGEVQVLANTVDLYAPRMVTIDLDTIQADANGNKKIPAGSVILKQANGFGRVYPLSELGSAITTSSTSLSVANAGLFKDGESLVVLRPYARINLGGTWAAGDTASVTLDGQTATYTVQAADDTTAKVATAAASYYSSTLGSKATFIADGTQIHVFGASPSEASIAVGKTGTGTIALQGSVTRLESGVTVGTLAASNSTDLSTNTLTLAAAAARALPAGAPIGVVSPANQIQGITVVPLTVDSSDPLAVSFSNDVACYMSAIVYGARLPYWDDFLQQILPEIKTI